MKKFAYLCIIAGGALWGCIGIFVRTLYAQGFSPMQLIAFRAYISAAILLVFLAVTDRRKLKIQLKDIWYFIGTGIVSFVFFNYCYFIAIGEASLSVAAVLLYTAPIFVMLMSLALFKEKLTGKKMIALGLAFCGCILVAGIGQQDLVVTKIGIIAGLLSGFLYALYSIFGRYALARYDSVTVTAYTFVFASIGVTPLADIAGIPTVLDGNIPLIFYIILFAVVSGVVPYMLYTKGLSYVQASKASIMASVEPIVATTIGIVCFAEPLTGFGIVGIAAVVVAIIVLNLPSRHKKNDRGLDRMWDDSV